MTRPVPARTRLGTLIMVVSQGATLARIEPFYFWHRPITWTGCILAVDGLVWKRRGSSWLSDARAEMLFLAFVSVPLWVVLHRAARVDPLALFGYAWWFATILPALFETGDLISSGAESILGDLRQRHYGRLINLLLAGLVCGFSWELWNYRAGGKWLYSVPILPNLRLFEMPLPGYLAFQPFAVECFVMYIWVRAFIWGSAARPVSI